MAGIASPILAKTGQFRRPELLRPNFLVVLIDDCGIDWIGTAEYKAEVQTYGGFGACHWPVVTKRIQTLADNGVTFLNARAQPLCSPTRAAIMTGRYGFRTGVGHVVEEENGPGGNAWEFSTTRENAEGFEEFIWPALLAPKGYSACVVGKWHLALPNSADWDGPAPPSGVYGTSWPHAGGFDWVYRGTFRNLDKSPKPTGLSGGDANEPGFHNFFWYESDGTGQVEHIDGVYHTEYCRQRLQNWINAQHEPWLAYAALSAIHSPIGNYPTNGQGHSGCTPPAGMVVTPQGTGAGQYDPSGIFGSSMSAIEAVDDRINALLNGIDAAVLERTYIFLVGDNGTGLVTFNASSGGALDPTKPDGAEPIGAPYSTVVIPNNHLKGSVYEAGVRVPLIVSGPGIRNGGRTTRWPVDAVDIYTTIRELARTRLDYVVNDGRIVDGISFAPVLFAAAADNDPDYFSRNYSFVERFTPNSRPADGTGATLTRDRGYSLRIPDEGVYKLVRKFTAPGPQTEEFYRIAEEDWTPSDPYESTNLGTGDSHYVEVATALQAHTTSEVTAT